MTAEDWNTSWKNNREAGWHMDGVNPSLLNHLDKLIKKENSTVFIPMCGKSVDMKFLADKGHTIVGVEYSTLGVEGFFKEHSIPFKKEEHESFVIYESTDKTCKIKIFCG